MVRPALVVLTLLTLVGGLAWSVDATGADAAPEARVRTGTYDSRAIAIAFAASEFNPVKEKMKQYEQAKSAGDNDAMKELEAWGERFQRQLHFQGFGVVPVEELLTPVNDGVAKLAQERDLVAIAMHCEYTGEGVETVDVTGELVGLYRPSEKTLTHVREIRKAKPIPLTELADLPANR